MYIYKYVYIYICIHIYVYMYIHEYICIHKCIVSRMCARVQLQKQGIVNLHATNMYTHIYACTVHTYTHIHM